MTEYTYYGNTRSFGGPTSLRIHHKTAHGGVWEDKFEKLQSVDQAHLNLAPKSADSVNKPSSRTIALKDVGPLLSSDVYTQCEVQTLQLRRCTSTKLLLLEELCQDYF